MMPKISTSERQNYKIINIKKERGLYQAPFHFISISLSKNLRDKRYSEVAIFSACFAACINAGKVMLVANSIYDANRETIQTDNGCEFCNTQKTRRVHYFDVFLNHLGITHKTIRPRTPWHNGKVERSRRNDQERFYNHLKFYSCHDLLKQMKAYLYRSNRIPMAVLGWKTPI